MNLYPSVAKIDATTLTYAPLVAAGIQLAEQIAPADATGPQKLAAVVEGVSAQIASTPGVNPNAQAIALLVTLGVSIANALGAFIHRSKTPVPAPAPTPTA